MGDDALGGGRLTAFDSPLNDMITKSKSYDFFRITWMKESPSEDSFYDIDLLFTDGNQNYKKTLEWLASGGKISKCCFQADYEDIG